MKTNILLIQFRKNKKIAEQESGCFYNTMKNTSNICIVNVFSGKDPLKRLTPSRFDGIILAGSGSFSFSEKNMNLSLRNKVAKTTPWVKSAIGSKVPVLGVCLGHQYIARMLGAEIINDSQQEEVGTFKITLTGAGKRSPLLIGLPDTFWVQEGHKDSVKSVPAGCEILAYSEKCKIQAFQVKDKNIYGIQFHAELNKKSSGKRLKLSPDYNLNNKKAGRFLPSPRAKKVLVNFIKVAKKIK